MSTPIIELKDLKLGFKSYAGMSDVLHGIDLSIKEGERVALVGESGSGKSVTARIILGLLQELKAARISGELRFKGEDLNAKSARERHALRGTEMAMIFQDPTSALNPVYTIGMQFHEVLKRRNAKIKKAEARIAAIEALKNVSIHEAERVLDSFAFQLSGGMNQRVMIAMALINNPSLLIADEPGTALDVTVQAQTLKLMKDLVEQEGTSVLFISHNLGVVREFADRVYVIYKGRIVEEGTTSSLFSNPQHAYTKALMGAVPRLTGGGLPDIPDHSDAFYDPKIVHDEVEAK